MRKTILTLLTLALCANVWGQVSFGEASLLCDDWRFMRVDSAWNIVDVSVSQLPDDERSWQRVQLPHDWSVELPMSPDKASCQGYLPGGIGWYKKTLPALGNNDAHPIMGKKKTYVYFEGIYNHSEVYLNGQLLGKRPSGFASLLYDLTPHLRPGGPNLLTVRVDHSQEADARWYTGSGINRRAWLVQAHEVHLAQWGTAYRLQTINDRKAVVDVDVETTDERIDKAPLSLNAVVELTDADGHVVALATTAIASQEKKTVRLTIKNPQRWTLDRPYLYTLTTKLTTRTDASTALDRSVVKAGLRTLEFSPDRGFALNGQWTKVKGVCLHDDAGCLGTAVPREVWRQRLIELKRIGTNAIRMSHNPHTPELYDLCDELGLLVMDEASDEWELPKRKWLKGWNQGVPGYQGTYTYFEEWIERDVADMVRRDRCHPSVFLWSIGNEVDYPNDPYSHPILDGGQGDFTQPMYGGYKPQQPNAERIGLIAQRLAAVVRNIDTSRPVTGALAGVVMSNETLYPQVIDVVGYNYTESRYQEDHAKYPKRVIYGSENRHDLPAWLAVKDNAHIFGQFLWTGIDYLGESGVWPARGSSAGLLDLKGECKPIGWYRAALWCTTPTCYIGTIAHRTQLREHRRSHDTHSPQPPRPNPYAPPLWNYDDGQRIRVMCYTNAPSASLTLNGQPVGGEPQRDAATGILFWDIDYASGTLLCQDTNGARYELKTSGQAHRLRLTVDRQPGDRVAIVLVEAVDSNGTPVLLADNDVTLYVSRGTRILGMENGDIMGTRPLTDRGPSHLRLYGGRLVAYVQTGEADSLNIRATSPLLLSATYQ